MLRKAYCFSNKKNKYAKELKAMAKVVQINEEARRIEQFNDVMANAKPMITEGRGKNLHTVTASACIPLSCCYVDKRYQGLRSHKRISQLESKFDKRKLTPITVVPHYDEHIFAIVDGQGRSIVAPKKGMDRLFATILMDAPDDLEARLKFEAEYFIGQDSEVENVKPLEKHLARVIIGDPAAVTIDKLIKEYKISFTNTQGKRGESILGSYTDTYSIAKNRGEKCLDFIFSIIKNAGWNHETNGYATFVMRALRDTWVEHPNDREAIHTYLSDALRQSSPSLFSTDARAKYPKRDHRMACTLMIEDMVCDNLNLDRKIFII